MIVRTQNPNSPFIMTQSKPCYGSRGSTRFRLLSAILTCRSSCPVPVLFVFLLCVDPRLSRLFADSSAGSPSHGNNNINNNNNNSLLFQPTTLDFYDLTIALVAAIAELASSAARLLRRWFPSHLFSELDRGSPSSPQSGANEREIGPGSGTCGSWSLLSLCFLC